MAVVAAQVVALFVEAIGRIEAYRMHVAAYYTEPSAERCVFVLL